MKIIRPGDICLVRHSGRFGGLLVEAVALAPLHAFTLPDGYPNAPGNPGDWIIKSLGQPFTAKLTGTTRTRECMYGVGSGYALFPIRGEAQEENAQHAAEAGV